MPKPKQKWQVVKDSEQPIPQWLKKRIGNTKRVWGQIVLSYPIDHIVPASDHDNNPRSDPLSGVTLLSEKVKRYGFIGLITVTPISRNPETGMIIYEVIDGDRRYYSLIDRGKKTVNIQVYEGSEKELAPLRLALNPDREIHQADQAIHMHKLWVKYGYTQDQIAQVCSTNSKTIGRPWVTTLINIVVNCIPEVIKAWRDGRIKKTHAVNISKQFTKTMRAKQLKALELSKSGTTAKELRSKLKKEKPKKTLKPKKRRRNSTKSKTSCPKTMFEMKKRYQQLLKAPSSIKNKAILREYQWILGIGNE